MGSKFEEKLKETPFVYHYTSLDALFAILEGYRQNGNSGLPFRASCIYNVNDPREMKLGFDAVKRFLPRYEERANYNMKLSKVYQNVDNENRCREDCYDEPIDGTIKTGTIPYTISFSAKRDFLPMWKMYGADFKGVCLKFNTLTLTDSRVEDPQVENSQFGFVSYEGDPNDLLLEESFNGIYKWETERNKSDMDINEKIDELSILCACISPFVKSSDWDFEKEFRLVYYKRYGLSLFDINKETLREYIIKHGCERSKVSDYIQISIPSNALEEVIVGPLANYEVVKHILCRELNECLLNDIEISQSSVKIGK